MNNVSIICIVQSAFRSLSGSLASYESLVTDWSQRRPTRHFVNDFADQCLVFHQNASNLLAILVDDRPEMTKLDCEQLLEDAKSSGWDGLELDTRLRERYPDSYELILETFVEMVDLLLDLRHELVTGQDPQDSYEAKDNALYPQGMSNMGEDPYLGNDRDLAITELFETAGKLDYQYCGRLFKNLWRRKGRHSFCTYFEKSNSRLQRHIPSQIERLELKETSKLEKVAQTRIPLSKLWRNAKSLYTPLSQRWLCKCRQHHQANLLLRGHDEDNDFQVLFLYNEFPSRESHPWAWLEMTIRTLDQPKQNEETSGSLEPAQSPDPNMSPKLALCQNPHSALKPRKKPPARKKVSWAHSRQVSDPDSEAQNPLTTPERCFCSILTTYFCDRVPFNISLQNEECRFHASPALTAVNSSTTLEKVSLDVVLHAGPGEGLSRRQRFSTAHMIASSMLELHSTPWLESSWNKTDIVFFRDSANQAAIPRERPYLSRKLEGHPKDQTDGSHDIVSESLGVVLLELCYGTTLEEFSIYKAFPVQPEQMNHSFRLRVATALCEKVVDEAGPEMQTAIKWCLKNRRSDINEHKWRKEFFSVVVLPLHNYTQYLAGKFLATEEVNHRGDVTSGGVAIYGKPEFFGETIVGGTHIHNHYP